MEKRDELVYLGKCSRPHGIKGGLIFHLNSGQDTVLQTGHKITIFPDSKESCIGPDGETVEISKLSVGNKIIAYLEGLEDRTAVESMLPFTIYALRSEFPEPEEGEFYVSDLVGLTALDESNGLELGKVVRTYDNGAQTIVVIQNSQGQSHEIPFVDQFVKSVDLEKGEVRVVRPEYVE